MGVGGQKGRKGDRMGTEDDSEVQLSKSTRSVWWEAGGAERI